MPSRPGQLERARQRHPLLAAAEPDVEAILISRTDSGVDCFIVPIDACYELAGRMRLYWRGFDGGSEARASIAEFLTGVRPGLGPTPGCLTWQNWSSTASVRPDKYAVTPSMSLRLRITETTGQRVDAIALRCQLRIEPARRRYTDDEAERLNDLFGDTARWADTLKPMQFTTVSTMVPGFTGSTEIDLPVPFTYDLEIGTTRYFTGLEGGEIPLLLLFSGTVFATVDGRLQVQQVPWSKEASYRLPVTVWQDAIDAHFPDSAWIKMSRTTLDELHRIQDREALPTWDATMLSCSRWRQKDRSGRHESRPSAPRPGPEGR